MAAGFIAHGDDRIAAAFFQPARLRDRGRGRYDFGAGRLHPFQQCRVRQAEVKADDFGPEILDQCAELGVERRPV